MSPLEDLPEAHKLNNNQRADQLSRSHIISRTLCRAGKRQNMHNGAVTSTEAATHCGQELVVQFVDVFEGNIPQLFHLCTRNPFIQLCEIPVTRGDN